VGFYFANSSAKELHVPTDVYHQRSNLKGGDCEWSLALVKSFPGSLNVARVVGVGSEASHSGRSIAQLVWKSSSGRGSHSSGIACSSISNALDSVVNGNSVWSSLPSDGDGGVSVVGDGWILHGQQETLIIYKIYNIYSHYCFVMT